MDIQHFLKSNEWQLVARLETEARVQETFSCQELSLSGEVQKYIQKKYPEGLYRHQREGVTQFLNGDNVCLTTSTASGKSDVFFLAAIEILLKDPDENTVYLSLEGIRARAAELLERFIC